MSEVMWIEEPASEQTTTCSEIPQPTEDGIETASLAGSAETFKTAGEVEKAKSEDRPKIENVVRIEEVEEDHGSSTLVEESLASVSPKESTQQLLTDSTAMQSTKEVITPAGLLDSTTSALQPITAPNRVRFAETEQEDQTANNNPTILPIKDGNNQQEQRNPKVKAEEDINLASVSETELQLDEYERKLRQNTKEALQLVDRLCEQQAQEQPARISRDNNATTLSNTNFSSGDEVDVDSLRVNPNLMQQPVDCLVMPARRVLVLDEEYGLMLLSLETKSIIRTQPNEQWRRPECATFVRESQHIMVLAECSVESTPPSTVESLLSHGTDCKSEEQSHNLAAKPHTYERFICRFDLDLKLVNKIEAPKYMRDKVVISCRLCYVEPTKSIYLAVSTPTQGFLYELNVENKWTEVYSTRGHNFADVQAFAVVGPVTELLLVETNRSYVLLVSIYSSQVVDRRMIAVCEKPETLTIDETGNLFVFDRVTCKVGHHSRIYFEKLREVALVERAHCRISASGGLLAVLNKQFKELKLYRY